MSKDCLDFVFFFAIYKVRWRSEEVRAVLRCFLVGSKERCMEDRVDLPLGGNVEAERRSRDNLFNLKQASPPYLEFLGSVHMEVGSF